MSTPTTQLWRQNLGQSPAKFEKYLGSSVTTRRKSWEKNPDVGVKSEIQRAKLRYLSSIFLEAKFGALTIISEANFGAKPPDLLIWKTPWAYTVDSREVGSIKDV